jgi:hypothetical protein
VTTAEQSTARSLRRAADSATVSYSRADGCTAVTVGEGESLRERVLDADSQLPPGEWVRDCVSTPASIYADLIGRVGVATQSKAILAFPEYEARTVVRP